jgi:hypothetical protein
MSTVDADYRFYGFLAQFTLLLKKRLFYLKAN